MEEESCIATVNTIAINVHCTTHFEKTTHFEFFFRSALIWPILTHFEIFFYKRVIFQSAHHHIKIIHNFNPGVMKFKIIVNTFLVIITKHYNFVCSIPQEKRRRWNIAFSLYDLHGQGVMKCTILVDLCLVIITTCTYNVLSLSDLCLGIEYFKINNVFHYMYYMTTLHYMNPALGVMTLTI